MMRGDGTKNGNKWVKWVWKMEPEEGDQKWQDCLGCLVWGEWACKGKCSKKVYCYENKVTKGTSFPALNNKQY